ncbi:MAG: large subunit ribosomal protein L18 [Verrucomicrobiales bacterium]|jgi:large subunit ribosomal protein L18
MSYIDRRVIRKKIHRRIRKKIAGTAERPRLAVYFSNKNVYAQLIDDDAGKTLVAASTVDKEVGHRGKACVASAIKVGEVIGKRAVAANVGAVLFDRGGHLYHGKVKALADAAREAGLKF